MSFEIRFWRKYPVAFAICIQINLSIYFDRFDFCRWKNPRLYEPFYHTAMNEDWFEESLEKKIRSTVS